MVFLTFSSFPHLFLGGCHALIEPRQQHGLPPLAQGHLGQQPGQAAGIRRRATQQGTCRPEKSAENPCHQCHQCHPMAFNPENTEIRGGLWVGEEMWQMCDLADWKQLSNWIWTFWTTSKGHMINIKQHRSSHLLPRTPSPACTRHGTRESCCIHAGAHGFQCLQQNVGLGGAGVPGGPGGPGGPGVIIWWGLGTRMGLKATRMGWKLSLLQK